MRKQTASWAFFLTGVGLLLPAAARADVAPTPPVFQRAAMADAIVLGRVTAVEDKEVELQLTAQATEKVRYQVAVVTVVEALKGAKGAKQVRFAFRPGKRRYGPEVKPGLEGIFCLSKPFAGPVYRPAMYYDITVAFAAPNYAEELRQFRRFGKLWEDTAAGLKSRDADVRFLTAAQVITRHRSPGWGSVRQIPIAATESKELLTALRSADWDKARPAGDPTPLVIFLRLGLTPKDGWKPAPGGDPAEMGRAAREWLAGHAADYRIQRFSSAPLEKKVP